nr:hypothetical protein [uncultured Trichococcus sp.]
MLKLSVVNHGKVDFEKEFAAATDIIDYLNGNTEEIFGWILENEPDAVLPDFSEVSTLDQVERILQDYDYSWWTVQIEEEEDEMLNENQSLEKIIELKETIDRSRRGLPVIAIYKNKAEVLEMLSATGDEDVNWAEYVAEAYADFEDDEKIIEVNLGNGLPEKFHAHEFKSIDEYIDQK